MDAKEFLIENGRDLLCQMENESNDKYLIELMEDYAKHKGGQIEPLVMPKIAEVIEDKKQKILSSLNEYLAETNPSEKHEQYLQIIADCEIQICNELLTELKSNFSA